MFNHMDPVRYYEDNVTSLRATTKRLAKKSDVLVMCKLFFFCCIVASICYIACGGMVGLGIALVVISLALYITVLNVDARVYREITSLRQESRSAKTRSRLFMMTSRHLRMDRNLWIRIMNTHTILIFSAPLLFLTG